ncbi:HAD hydrolase-like protein [Alishewanella sp. BS5-314]|uniref:HAD family hydrolase n=1 Tax=Alishewanella sp. BS5-314 TaxID=2755587 RepID=UPI0021BB3420|nr:HAD family hydrolase [Alishewanella sp. BS5-314]MCT8125530.1 HAD hydrolase-like protein [Alishewanella sp. BS5-314]
MIYIFDLDDTLYDERQYVDSGLRAVARFVANRWQLDEDISYQTMQQLLDSRGRGRIFDDLLAAHGLATKANVKACVSCYRLHQPQITMPAVHHQLLQQLPKPLYLVTDGNKIVQQKKVQALGIAHYFKRIFITHRFGVKHAKPSTYCFELIKKAEQCEWPDMAYIGDNPAKDFVNLNTLGMYTLRVLTGVHRHSLAKPGYDAGKHLASITELLSGLQSR